MKRTITIIAILVVAAIVAVCGIKYAADRTERNMQTLFDMPVPNVTVEETTTEVEETTTEAPTTVPTTKKPPVVTTETPKTGDTSAVIAAIATISVASAAAFVCLKKKEN